MTRDTAATSSISSDLLMLAQERSSEKRLNLLRHVTNGFLQNASDRSAAEQYLFDEVISHLVARISGPSRVQASETLSKMPNLPAGVAQELATDPDIAVAGPIVRDHQGLQDDLLLHVAMIGSQDHLNSLAGRRVVTSKVTDVVVVRGDQRAVRTLAANHNAQFSDAGMRRLVDRAKQDLDLQSLLVERADLTSEAVQRLIPLVSSELAQRLRGSALELDEVRLGGHLTQWVQERKENIAQTDAYVELIRSGELDTSQVVITLAAKKRLLDIVTVLAALIDLDRYYSFNVLTRGKTQLALLLLKSVGASWPAVAAFLKLRNSKFDGRAGIMAATSVDGAEYEGMNRDMAQRIIRFMKVRRVSGAVVA